jgi:pimeloyl-ACP methyl ester carboxylesterase
MKREPLCHLALWLAVVGCGSEPLDTGEPSTTITSGSPGSGTRDPVLIPSAANAGATATRMQPGPQTTTAPLAGAGGMRASVTGSSAASPASAGRTGAPGSTDPVARNPSPAADSGTTAQTTPAGAHVRGAEPTEQSVKNPGEYSVMSYTELDGLVGGAQYGDAAIAGDGSQLYYPVEAKPPFAAMVIVPGFTAQRGDVAPWGQFLASHGIIGLVIDTNTVGDTPDIRAGGLQDGLESLKKENMREGSPIRGNIDVTRLGVMGWSMGGGGTWMTADARPELKAVISLCGWIIGPVGGATKVPSLQLASVGDPLAAGMSQPVYQAIPESTPKMMIEFSSADHWLANDPANAGQQIGRFGLAWLKVHLEGDERYRQFLKTMPNDITDFATNVQ